VASTGGRLAASYAQLQSRFPSHGICLIIPIDDWPKSTSRPWLSDSPPLLPIDTRSPNFFPLPQRDYTLSAVGSGAGPSSPTTPSSVNDSPPMPFSPHYASSPYGGLTHGHSHSHSHSSSASASGYIPGTPLLPLIRKLEGCYIDLWRCFRQARLISSPPCLKII